MSPNKLASKNFTLKKVPGSTTPAMMPKRNKSRGFKPDYCFTRARAILPTWLLSMEIEGLLLDIDNTITRWESLDVPAQEMAWIESLHGAGINLRLLSNGLVKKKQNVTRQTGIGLVRPNLPKPSRVAFAKGLDELALPPAKVLMVGDSVFTDIAGANRAGIWTALVEPLSPVDFIGSKVYRMLEAMFQLRQPLDPKNDFRRVNANGK